MNIQNQKSKLINCKWNSNSQKKQRLQIRVSLWTLLNIVSWTCSSHSLCDVCPPPPVFYRRTSRILTLLTQFILDYVNYFRVAISCPVFIFFLIYQFSFPRHTLQRVLSLHYIYIYVSSRQGGYNSVIHCHSTIILLTHYLTSDFNC